MGNRNILVLKMIMLAVDECFCINDGNQISKEKLINSACQYGKSYKVISEECNEMLEKTLYEIIGKDII